MRLLPRTDRAQEAVHLILRQTPCKTLRCSRLPLPARCGDRAVLRRFQQFFDSLFGVHVAHLALTITHYII